MTILRLGFKGYHASSLPILYLPLLFWAQREKCGTPRSTDLQLKAELFQLNYGSVRISDDCFKPLSLVWFVIQNYWGNR